jgi:Nickel/cobalt transporter regulator
MRTFTLALILASTAFVPAFAQEVEVAPVEALAVAEVQAEVATPPRYFEQKQSLGERPIQMARRDDDERRGERMSDMRGRAWPQPQPQVQPQPVPQAQSAEQPSRNWDGGNWNGGGRGTNRVEQPQPIPQPMPQPSQQQTWQGNRGGWNRGGDGQAAPQQQDGGRRWNRDGDRDRNDGAGRQNGDWRGRGGGDTTRPVPPVFQPQPQPQQGGGWDRNNDNRDWNRNRGDQGNRDWNRNDRNGQGDRDWNSNDRNGQGSRDWNRDGNHDQRYGNGRNNSQFGWRDNNRGWDQRWRNDRRYDWRGYRNQYQDRYRIGRYDNPYGYRYGYQSFGIGIYLDQLFFGRTYWLSDPWNYRLPTAPYGYRWVRYYNDVLLVDLRTGYVEDMIRDFFW